MENRHTTRLVFNIVFSFKVKKTHIRESSVTAKVFLIAGKIPAVSLPILNLHKTRFVNKYLKRESN